MVEWLRENMDIFDAADDDVEWLRENIDLFDDDDADDSVEEEDYEFDKDDVDYSSEDNYVNGLSETVSCILATSQ